MGQKIHPYGLRLGIVTDWKSRWYSEKDYAAQVNEDYRIRKYLRDELTRGAVSRIDIERIGDKKVQIDIHTGRPGVVIGRGGAEAERLRSGLEDLSGRIVKFNVIEVSNPELDAQLLARSVADQLEGRVAFRRAMKRTVTTAMKAGAEGVRVQAQGRLGGADMGRREWYLEGRVPLHTLRADIDYGQATARTSVGAVGIKVWVYRGDLLTSVTARNEKIAAEARLAAGGPAQRRRSARSRAESAAGEAGGKRLIEAGGGKRPVESGAGNKTGKRLIEAGGGRRKPTTGDAAAEFKEARRATEDGVEDAVVSAELAAIVAEAAAVEAVVEAVEAETSAVEAVETAVVAEAVAEEAEIEAVVAEIVAEVAVEEAVVAEVVAEETGSEEAIVEAVIAEERAEEAVVEAAVAEALAAEAEEIAEAADDGAIEATVEAVVAEEEAVEAVAKAIEAEAVAEVEETPTVETTEVVETQKVEQESPQPTADSRQPAVEDSESEAGNAGGSSEGGES